MSDPVRIALVGATGLIGRTIMQEAVGRGDCRLLALARREIPLPQGACMDMVVAEPAQWGTVMQQFRPTALISALGTTWKKAGRDEVAFRAVDQDLVLETARAAHAAGVERMVAISSAGADSASRNFYLKVKGEVEQALGKIGFTRLDVMRPGLLRGKREGDRRLGERIGIVAAPLTDLAMQGRLRPYRSVRAEAVAQAALALSMKQQAGRFRHDSDSIQRVARGLPQIETP